MIKDDADAILEQAKLLLDDDVSVERRVRVARKILEHARSIKAVCMAEPAIKHGANRQTITVNIPPIAAPTTVQKQIAEQIAAGVKRALAVKAEPTYTLLPKSGPTTVTLPRKEHVWGRCWVDGVLVSDGVPLPPYTDWPAPVVTGHGVVNSPPIIPGT